MPADEYDAAHENILKAIRTHKPMDYEYEALMKDGSTHWHREVSSFAYEDAGSIIYHGTVYNIDRTKEAEAEAADARKRLELSNARMKLAFRQNRVEIWEYNIKTHIFTLISSAKLKDDETFSISKSDLFTKTSYLSGDSAADFTRMLKDLEDGTQSVSSEVKISQSSGARWFKTSYAMMPGEKEVAIGLSIEITREKELSKLYESESSYRKSLAEGAILLFECDVVSGEVMSKNFLRLYDLDDSCNIFEVAEKKILPLVHPTDQYNLKELLSPGELMRDIARGKTETYFEARFLSSIQKYEGYRWRSVRVNYVVEQTTGHPRAFVCVRDIDEAKKKELEALKRANYDSLTGLCNRAAFVSMTNEALAKSADSKCAFMIIDIDNFKSINDTYGHMFGDDVLCLTAGTLRSAFHSNDIIGRLGGDEFAVCMTDIPTPETAFERGLQLCTELAGGGHQKSLPKFTVSVGIAMSPADGATFKELYGCADRRLYSAKNSGKNRCCIFDDKAED